MNNLQNPTLIRFIGTGPTTTYYGRVTGKRYKFGGSVTERYVDERDLVGFTTRKFEVVVEEEIAKVEVQIESPDGEETVIEVEIPESYDEPVEIEVGEESTITIEITEEVEDDLKHHIDFLESLSEYNKSTLIENGVEFVEDLNEKGIEWFNELPRVSDTKALKVFSEIENLLGE